MKYAWLLALPYVVTISTVSGPGDYLYTIMYHVGEFALGNKEQAEDFAQALNDAHERRNTPSLIPITDDKGNFSGWK